MYLSPEFACAFLLLFPLYWMLVRRVAVQNVLLLAFSYLFYAGLDVRMPVMTGLDCARAIRALEKRLGRGAMLPLVAVTANVSATDRAAAFAAGMDDCLAKPLEREALLRWLERVSQGTAGSLSA